MNVLKQEKYDYFCKPHQKLDYLKQNGKERM